MLINPPPRMGWSATALEAATAAADDASALALTRAGMGAVDVQRARNRRAAKRQVAVHGGWAGCFSERRHRLRGTSWAAR